MHGMGECAPESCAAMTLTISRYYKLVPHPRDETGNNR